LILASYSSIRWTIGIPSYELVKGTIRLVLTCYSPI